MQLSAVKLFIPNGEAVFGLDRSLSMGSILHSTTYLEAGSLSAEMESDHRRTRGQI